MPPPPPQPHHLYIIALTTLLVPTPIQPSQPTTARAQVITCAAEHVTSRLLLEQPLVTSSRLHCLGLCGRDERCHLAVFRVATGGNSMCFKYSKQGLAFGTDWNATAADADKMQCSMMTLVFPGCQNGGVWQDPICLCPTRYTGQFCQLENPSFCNSLEDNMDMYSITDIDVIEKVITDLGGLEMHRRSWKAVYNDTALQSFLVHEIDSIDYSSTPTFHAHALHSVTRTAWDRLDAAAERQFFTFSFMAGIQTVRRITTDPATRSVGNADHEPSPFVLKLSKDSRFHFDIDLTQNSSSESDLQARLKMGYEPFEIPVVKLGSDLTILENSFKNFELRGTTDIPYWRMSKFVLPEMLYHLYAPVLGMGTKKSLSSVYNLGTMFMDPCWREVGMGFGLRTESMRRRVMALLENGHRFRLYDPKVIVAQVSNVISVLRVENEVYLFQTETLSDTSSGEYSIHTTEVKGVKALSGYSASCQSQLGGQNVLFTTSGDSTTFKLFVDTRKWIKVYQVYSNSSVVSGHVTDLADAILAGRDVNIWLRWMRKDVDEFFATQVNTINWQGQVSSESVQLYSHSSIDTPPVRLANTCGFKKILVSTQGRVEVMEYNIYTPGTIQEVDDVVITWFLN